MYSMGNRLQYCSVSTSVFWFNTWSDIIHAKIGAMAFVPAEEVERGLWRTLKPLLRADMVSFISFFESTWVGTSTTSPLFSHDMWNQHDTSLMLIPRSSNIAEGWHHCPLNAFMFQPYTLEVSLEVSHRPEAGTEKAPSTTRARSAQVDKVWPETAEYWPV